jgi:hypothetical protein
MAKIKQLAVTTAGIVLSFTAMEANSAQAATITVDFTVTGTSGSILNQQFSGFYSFDDSTTPTCGIGCGGQKFPLSAFDFNFNKIEYTLSDLLGNGNFAGYGGSATGLVATTSPGGGPPYPPGGFLFGNEQFYSSVGEGGVAYSERTPASVPEPATLGGLCVFGLSSVFLKKKVASKRSNN